MNQQESHNLYDPDEKYSVKEGLVKLKITSGNGHDVKHDIYWEDQHYYQDNLELGLGSKIKAKFLRISSNCTKTSPSESVNIKYEFKYDSTSGEDDDEYERLLKFDGNERITAKARFEFQ